MDTATSNRRMAEDAEREADREQERMFRESRLSGERSIEVALAEIQLITHNVYVQRQERTLAEEEIPVCSCQVPEREEKGCLEDCVNRVVLTECIAGYCPCGDKCDNQRIQIGKMPEVQIVDCGKKGLGLVTRQKINVGDFVGEYMGEIVTEQEYHMRRLLYHKEKHRYMMVLSGGEVIDATRMGGMARFINHSCEPNCRVEKWDVNGEERCGIFSLQDISYGEELTFDYKFQSFSMQEVKECLCGAPNCRKVFGMNNRVVKAASKSAPVVQPEKPRILDPIVPGGKHPLGKKAADSLLDRMSRVISHQRILTKKEAQLIQTSRVALRRNLTRLVDNHFRFLMLEQYFYSAADGKLENVPPIINFEKLIGFPMKPRVLSPEEKHLRLVGITEFLRERRELRQRNRNPTTNLRQESTSSTTSKSAYIR